MDEADPGDSDEVGVGGSDAAAGGRTRGARGQQQRGQEVPIRNLARYALHVGGEAGSLTLSRSFLGEAFGAPPAHPADDMNNNPFAEGHEPTEPDDRRQCAQSEDQQQEPLPFGNLGGGVGRLDGGQGATPLSYLFSLLNSFGVNMGGGQAGNYAWGEADFQQILNDLMEQVRWLRLERGTGLGAQELILSLRSLCAGRRTSWTCTCDGGHHRRPSPPCRHEIDPG